MSSNRVVEGRMVTAKSLAEQLEGEDIMDAEPIKDADRDCPDCGGNVLTVGYMPSALSFVTGYKCQDCPWQERDND